MHRLRKKESEIIVFKNKIVSVCVRGFKSLKQFCPYSVVFRSYISTGKLSISKSDVCLFVFFFGFMTFMKSSFVYAVPSRTFLRFETVILPSTELEKS